MYTACRLRGLAGDAGGRRGLGKRRDPGAAPRSGGGWEKQPSARGGGSEAAPAPRSTAGGGDTPSGSPMGIVALPLLPFPLSTPSPRPGRREAAALQPSSPATGGARRKRQPRTAPSPPPQKHLRGGRMPGGGRPPPRERGLAPEPPQPEGGGGREEEEKGAGGKWGSCALPAPPRAGAMGPAGGARAAPSLLLSLLLGASAPLWLRAETLGECGAGRGGSAGAAPRVGGERRGAAGCPRRPRLAALRECSLSCSRGCI